MAILGEIEAKVMVDGVPANEYDDDEETAASTEEITKYVEAVSGANFEIKVLVGPGYTFAEEDAVSCSVYVDGEYGAGRVRKKDHVHECAGLGESTIINVDGRYSMDTSGRKLYKFQFADLETRDMEKTDDVSKFKDQYAELGTLRVEMWRDIVHGDQPLGSYNAKNNEAVPEKALKGRPLDVAARLVPVNVHSTAKACATSRPDKHPFATFIFKYRTRRALQSLMIVERSPTPMPLEERPIEELTRAEMAELLRRQREQQRVKKEFSHKRERGGTVENPRPLKTSKGSNGETVYHLDSDDEEVEEQQTNKEIEVVEL